MAKKGSKLIGVCPECKSEGPYMSMCENQHRGGKKYVRLHFYDRHRNAPRT